MSGREVEGEGMNETNLRACSMLVLFGSVGMSERKVERKGRNKIDVRGLIDSRDYNSPTPVLLSIRF